jgi:hypothetical protein
VKFLVDQNRSPRLAQLLREAGHDAVHTLEHLDDLADDADVKVRPHGASSRADRRWSERQPERKVGDLDQVGDPMGWLRLRFSHRIGSEVELAA